MSFVLLNNPLLSTIQDAGRKNLTHLGITNSGVMDMYAYTLANQLLSNKPNTNILEIYHGNITLQVNKNTIIAFTGAHTYITLNNNPIKMYQSYKIKKGDTLKIGKTIRGLITYMSVKGGFDLKKHMGSNSTTIKEQIGGITGLKLQKGDILPYDSVNTFIHKRIQAKFIPNYPGLFKNLCQSGKIKNTKGHRDEDRNRCRTIC